MRTFFLASLALFISGCVSPRAPELIVPANPVLSGEPIVLRVSGVEPGSEISILTERVYGRWQPSLRRAKGYFLVNESGVVDTRTQAPLTGTYSTVDPAGLFWSMQPTEATVGENPDKNIIAVKVDINGDDVIDLERTVTLINGFPDLIEEPLGDDFEGAFTLRQPGNSKRPVIFVLGGSEGGDSAARSLAPKFASRGYIAVGLPYYSPAWGGNKQQFPNLPQAFADIPLDYLGKAKQALKQFSYADTDRIGLYGVSKGAEFVLGAASLTGGFSAVAAIVPSDVYWEGWGASTKVSSFSWNGTPMAYLPYQGMEEEFKKEKPILRNGHDQGREAFPDKIDAAKIDVVAIDEPVFVVGGDSDQVWDSGGMSRIVKTTRDSAGLETEIYVSEDAGHYLSGDGYSPTSRANAKLQLQAWPALLEFFERNLLQD